MHYADNLEDRLAKKTYLGHYANEPMPLAEGRRGYEADQGWDALFTDELRIRDEQAARAARSADEPATGRTVIRRVGATVLEITAQLQRRRHQEQQEDEPRL
jgi:hypothetical protein